jgi:hypothetical protein
MHITGQLKRGDIISDFGKIVKIDDIYITKTR